ncbi:MAG: DUF4303 domain-containing protein [Rhodoglobus sp.]
MSGINWREIEEAAAGQIVSAVRAVREEHPDESVYGAMFHEFYGDGSVIYWPMVTVGTEESLAEVAAGYAARHGEEEALESSLRWSGPDLARGVDPGDSEQALADSVHAAASSSGEFDDWERVYDRFLRCFPKAAKLARKQLVAEKLVGKEFIAIAEDEAGELVPLSLTKSQLLKHFPQYDAAEQERRRLAALPVEKRVLELLPSAVAARHEGPLAGEYEGLMVECGAAALPALARVTRGEEYLDGGVAAARMLAEINISTPEVVEALDGLMRREDADINARAWAASALARLDCSELILARVSELPVEVVTRGISGPFRGFRDRGAHRPLDYGPLDAVLRAYPLLEPSFEKELKPGVGYCALGSDEVPAARAALNSPWNVIQTHARMVLENAGVIRGTSSES